ncbi:MAG TPA: hypothetical protein VLA24_09255 [Pseudomonadales bacterium]|nr:hypothetical protein [Pseudomonadales bacterium]
MRNYKKLENLKTRAGNVASNVEIFEAQGNAEELVSALEQQRLYLLNEFVRVYNKEKDGHVARLDNGTIFIS